MKYCYLILLVFNVAIVLALPFIIFIYNLSPETSQMVREIIIMHSVFAVFIWAPSFTLPNTLRAANDVTYCMVVSILSMWIFRIGFSYLLGQFLGLGVLGVWIAMVVDQGVRGILFLIRYRGTKWMHLV
jgi:Na+-driven multidrug efflux pump